MAETVAPTPEQEAGMNQQSPDTAASSSNKETAPVKTTAEQQAEAIVADAHVQALTKKPIGPSESNPSTDTQEATKQPEHAAQGAAPFITEETLQQKLGRELIESAGRPAEIPPATPVTQPRPQTPVEKKLADDLARSAAGEPLGPPTTEAPAKTTTPDFLKNVPLPNTEPEVPTKSVAPDSLKNTPASNAENKSVPKKEPPLEQDIAARYFEKVSGTQATTTTEATEGSAQEHFTALQQELVATMAQKGVTAELYRQGNRVSAEYTDKDGKSIGLESIRAIFGAEQTLKIADLAGKLEVALYANPELSQELAVRETSSEKVSRLASESIDRLGAFMRSKADQLKPKGLWAQAKGWLNRGKERVASINTSFQSKVSEIRQQRSERRVAANFQRFSKTFNLMTPDMVRADRAMVGLMREIDTKSEEYVQAADVVSGLSESIRRLKVMESRIGRMKEIRDLEKRRENFQRQMNMLRGQLAKLSTNYTSVDQELKQQQALEYQSLDDQLRAKNPEKPTYVGPEIPEVTPGTEPAKPRESYVGPEIDEPSSTNAPDDRTTPMGTRQPYYSQEQEMNEIIAKAQAEQRTATDFDRAQAAESATTVDTSAPARTIPVGPPAAAPDTVAPAGPEANPEATGGEAA